MKAVSKWKIFLLLLVFPTFLLADIRLDLQLTNPDANIFRLGDLDITQLGTSLDIFNFTLENLGPDPEHIIIRFEVRVNGILIVWTETDPFEVPVGQPYFFTQSQINQGTAVILDTQGIPQHPKFKQYDVNLNALQDLQNQVLSTGKLPAGTYEFLVQAISVETGKVYGDENPENNILVISNPTTLLLLFPGNPVSDPTTPVLYTSFPFFQWQADAKLFNFFLYKKLPGDSTIQDVFSHPPILRLANYTQLSLQYPSDTGPLSFPGGGRSVGPIRLLEFGETYYWYVQAVIPTLTAVPQILNSEVFKFKIADISEIDAASRQIILLLRQILGPRYRTYLDRLQKQGYSPNGNVYINGRRITDLNTLLQIVNKSAQDQVEVQNVTVY